MSKWIWVRYLAVQHYRNKRCLHCPARINSLCSVLNHEEIGELSEISVVRHFSKGEVIFSDESPSTSVYNVISGSLNLQKIDYLGNRQVMGFYFAGDFFGFPCNGHNQCSALALTSLELCIISRKYIMDIFFKFPAMQQKFIELLSLQNKQLMYHTMLLGRKTASQKIASFLLLLFEKKSSNAEGDNIYLPMSRLDISDFLGLRSETVSRILSRLESKEIIRTKNCKNLKLINLEKLKTFL